MTCIAALKSNGTVIIASDSLASADYTASVLKQKKVFRKGEMLIGVSGTLRTLQLIQYSLILPERGEAESDEEYITKDVVSSIRSILKEHGDAWKISERDSIPSVILIAYKSEIYVIQSDFGVRIVAREYEAIGSGAEHAIGVLFATKGDPQERLKIALEAAQEHGTYVRKPFYFDWLNEDHHGNNKKGTKIRRSKVVSMGANS